MVEVLLPYDVAVPIAGKVGDGALILLISLVKALVKVTASTLSRRNPGRNPGTEWTRITLSQFTPQSSSLSLKLPETPEKLLKLLKLPTYL
jgi:hypothetical protein